MRTATKAFLGIVLGVVQIGWLFLWLFIFIMMGYDGGGFAGGLSPLICASIIALPTIIAGVVWAAFKVLKVLWRCI